MKSEKVLFRLGSCRFILNAAASWRSAKPIQHAPVRIVVVYDPRWRERTFSPD